MTLDASGNLYIADTNNHRIREVSAATGIITTIAGNGFMNGNGTGGYNSDGIAATSAELNFPYAVAFDAAGDMYIPDSANNRIREVMAVSGAITAAARSRPLPEQETRAPRPAGRRRWRRTAARRVVALGRGRGCGRECLHRGDAKRRHPQGERGHRADLDPSRERLRRFLLRRPICKPVQLYGPTGLYLDGSGDLYVADTLDMVVREIQGNFAALQYSTPVFQGETSATQTQTVENDGNATLDLTTITARHQRRDRWDGDRPLLEQRDAGRECGLRDRRGVCSRSDSHSDRQSDRDAQY